MNMPQWIKDWVVALKSDKYEQGTGFLCEIIDGQPFYCCLGVLCEINNVPHSITKIDNCTNSKDTVKSYGGADRHFPPKTLSDKLKLDIRKQFNLSDLNDEKGYTFEQIADWIEANWQTLLVKA